VYRDDRGETPVLEAVRRAESALLARQSTKSYVGPAGNPAFNEAIERLVLGDEHEARLTARVRTVQAPGGCGALRLGAELIRIASPDSLVHVSTPTWANHSPLLSGSGLRLERYPYFDPATGGVQFDAMTAALERLPARAVVLLHASCHNPTGADLSPGNGVNCWRWSNGGSCCRSSTWRIRGSAPASRRTRSVCACSVPSFPRCCVRCRARRTSACTASAPERCT